MMKVMGGGLMKVLGPLFKVLKLVFKVLKFTALGFALIAAGIFFSMSEADQEKTIDTVVSFFKKVGKVLKAMAKAFGGAFMNTMDDAIDPEGNPIEGLVTKFGKFKEAWSAVLKKLSGISMKVGGKTYKGLEGFASMMGDLFGKIAGWFLDLGTGIAELITDPRKILTKMSVAISNFFGGIIDTVFRFVDEYTSMEFLLSLLPPWVREIGFVQEKMKTASQSRAKDKMKDMEDLAARDKLLLEREEDAQKSYDESAVKIKAIDDRLNNEKIKLSDTEREKLEAEKKGYDDDRIAVYDLLKESQAERERNKDRFEYAKQSYEASSEIALKERANQILMKTKNKNFIALEEKLAEQEKHKRKLLDDHVEGSGMINEIELSLSKAREVQKLLGVEGTKAGREKLTQANLDKKGMAGKLAKLGIKSGDVDDLDKIKDLLSGLQVREDSLKGIDINLLETKGEKADLAPAMKAAYDQARKESGVEVATLAKPTKQVDPNKPVKVVKQPDVNKPKPIKEPTPDTPKYKDFSDKITSMSKDNWFSLPEQNILFKMIAESGEDKEAMKGILFGSPLMGMFKAKEKGAKTAAVSKEKFEKNFRGRFLQEGGLVTETGLGMLHGTVPKPELVLDNQAAALFMKAADKLSGLQLMNLQRDKSTGLGEQKVGAAINVINNSSQQINQNSAMVLPPSPIQPGNSENALS